MPEQDIKSFVTTGILTDVDIIFVIDVTKSMSPYLESVKNLANNLYPDLVEALKGKARLSDRVRAKVITFRDFYENFSIFDATEEQIKDFVLKESDFYDLTNPESCFEFNTYISGLVDDGGGDEPENALEALAAAMKVLHGIPVPEEGNRKSRQIIILCTDASAHALDCGKTKPSFYPEKMPANLAELKAAWYGNAAGENQVFNMNQQAKRLVLFAPNAYPWDEIGGFSGEKWTMVFQREIAQGEGGKDLDGQTISELLAVSAQ